MELYELVGEPKYPGIMLAVPSPEAESPKAVVVSGKVLGYVRPGKKAPYVASGKGGLYMGASEAEAVGKLIGAILWSEIKEEVMAAAARAKAENEAFVEGRLAMMKAA